MKLDGAGRGHCRAKQIYSSRAWALDKRRRRKDFNTKRYKNWMQAAWTRCLKKDKDTTFVSVWKDAGFRCYKGDACKSTGKGSVKSWTPALKAKSAGRGFCTAKQVFSSRAWALTKHRRKKGFGSTRYKNWVKKAWARCLETNPATTFVSVWNDAGYRCYVGNECKANNHRLARSWSRTGGKAIEESIAAKKAKKAALEAKKKAEANAVTFDEAGKGHCRAKQIYSSRAWALDKRRRRKGFNTKRYKNWMQAAWTRCLKKDKDTTFVSVWKDAGFRCYKGDACKSTGKGSVKSWTPALKAKSAGRGFCTAKQVFSSRAWALTKHRRKKGFGSTRYKNWVKKAWARCLETNPATTFVSVWNDAGYRCYVGNQCKANNHRLARSWSRTGGKAIDESIAAKKAKKAALEAKKKAEANAVTFDEAGKGHCSATQIYSSRAWALDKRRRRRAFRTKQYKRWVKAAWARCLKKDKDTTFVSVWKDAGFRCYKGDACKSTGKGSVKSWTPALKAKSAGRGFCTAKQVFSSRAWALTKHRRKKGFGSTRYKNWVKKAWARCLETNPATTFVSVWNDAGYRCYVGNQCKANNHRLARSWSRTGGKAIEESIAAKRR